jgi:hypothetical protein
MPVPFCAQVATSACEKPDSIAPPAMPVTLASEPLLACAGGDDLARLPLTALAIMPPTG